MNKNILILVGGFVALVVIGWFVIGRKGAQKKVSLVPQTNSEGAVEVEITPIDISEGSIKWQFDISLNTHSVELGQDMTKIGFLKDDKGNIYQPTSWEGAPPGGHHREGVLVFNPISPRPSSFELIIQNIGGIAERKFGWRF